MHKPLSGAAWAIYRDLIERAEEVTPRCGCVEVEALEMASIRIAALCVEKERILLGDFAVELRRDRDRAAELEELLRVALHIGVWPNDELGREYRERARALLTERGEVGRG